MTGPIRAAGGVVFRKTAPKGIEVLLVHRPSYDDWTFPKGKTQGDETDEQCAIREVEEETGMICLPGGELSNTSYIDRRGRPKVVRYWAMTSNGGAFKPNQEVDEARWIKLPEAASTLTYDHDRELLGELAAYVANRDPLYLLRHGMAGRRGEWEGDDALRPLDKKGRKQAAKLAELFGDLAIERILSSPFVRCVQTVEPLSEAMGIPIETRKELAEGAGPKKAASLLEEISGTDSVLCTHGDVIADLIGYDRPAKKGSVWVLERDGGKFAPSSYLPPPA